MKDILQDVVAHTHSLGFLNLVKVSSDDATTNIESMAEDRSVIMSATLALHLKCPEYQKDSKIEVVSAERNGETVPTHIHFENATGDFQNDYRFMNKQIIEEKLKTVKFKGASWDVEFSPSMASIQRMKFQSLAHSEETVFSVKSEGTNLMFNFGDASTHAGQFVFETNANGELKHSWSWPVAQVQAILGLDGKLSMKISDQGAMMITVDSGMTEYNYILPAQSK